MILATIPGTQFELDQGAQGSLLRAVAAGCPLQITTAYRSREYQARLYAMWKAGTGNFALPPGQSLHEQGLAVDFGRASSNWLEDHGADYGWFRPTGWNAPGIKNPEWWHWEYNMLRDTQLFASTQEIEMTPEQAQQLAEVHWMLNRIREADIPDLRENAGHRVWAYKNPTVPTGDKDAYWHLLNPKSQS